MLKPAIVIAAYNRPKCLTRLLRSVENGRFPIDDIPLIFSLDKSENNDVSKIAENFNWPHGDKRIIQHKNHLGLKEHILSCGDLTNEYGSVILLEDDLLVSPYFYDYALSTINFYHSDKKIAGISLYSYEIAESCFFPFHPIQDDSDVYFMQFAASWGQAWTSEQWESFRYFFQTHPATTAPDILPDYVKNWPDQSWKKHFIHYLMVENKYFVFPRVSYTTNFSTPGTHEDRKGLYQVELQTIFNKPNYIKIKESNAIYDSWFELLPRCLNNITDVLKNYSFVVDLYGQKNIFQVNDPYLLTTKYCTRAITSFGYDMTPNISNIVNQIDGNKIFLTKREHVSDIRPPNFWYHQKIKPIADILFGNNLKVNWEQSPLLSFDIIINLDNDLQKLHDTLSSIEKQRYPFLNYIFVTDLLEQQISEIITTFQLTNYAVVSIDPASPLNTCQEILRHAHGELFGMLTPGDRYLPGSLHYVNKVFKSFPAIKWMTGLPTWFNEEGNIIRQEMVPTSRHSSKTIERSIDIQPASLFWHRSLLEKSITNLSKDKSISFPNSLWLSFFEHEPLHTGCFYVGGSPLKNRTTSSKHFLNPFWYFFKNDIVFLRYFYKKLKSLPDVIRYDYENDSFYLSQY